MTQLDVSFDFEASLTGLNKRLDRLNRLQKNALRAVTPVFSRVFATGIFPASGGLILNLGGPEQGRFWYVRSIQVGGLSPTTAALGRADIFVSGMDLRAYSSNAAPLAQVGLQDWRDQAVTLPAVAPYSHGGLPLRLNENLFVIFSNGTSGQQYVAAAQIIEYEEAAGDQDWSK